VGGGRAPFELMAVARVDRKLAAILAADVVGYSRLMGADEEGTHARLKAHQSELIDPAIAAHHGHIVKLTGDGALVEFGSVVDAVVCAVEIQRGMAERNAGVADNQRIAFRIGINLGDVIVDAGDIYGDGVNVAARLEALAQPGGIYVSDLVYHSVEAKLDVPFEDLGERRLKNIAKPVRIYRVRMGPGAAGATNAIGRLRLGWPVALAAALVVLIAMGVAGWRFYFQPLLQERAFAEETALPLPDKPSIAVLPFDNLSGDPGQGYFSDGITDELTTRLSQLAGLFVIARNTAFTYKGRPVNIRDVGRQLGVRYVLEGSVQQAGGRARINAQLIDAASGFHLWAERFDGRLEDIFALQDEVTSNIVAALQIELSEAEERKLAQRYTSSPEAYDEFLKGWEQLFLGTVQATLRARRHFERAIQLDPTFARAYANLALTYFSGQTGIAMADASLEKAYELAQTAVALDATLPQVHWVLSLVQLYRREYEQALDASNAAIALEPNFADAYGQQAWILNLRGRPAEGLPLIEQAMRLNPRYPAGYLEEAGKIQLALGHYDAAIATLEAVRERNPNMWLGRLFLAAGYVHAGRLGDAEWEIDEILIANPGFSLEALGNYVPYEHPADLARLSDALKTAGPT
jgi:TolB-like protein/class 3 adenylate cyclase/Tfp pilus assembly protein PilF